MQLVGVLSSSQQFHVTQCHGGMSRCKLFSALTLYLMISRVLSFGGTLYWDELLEICEVHGRDFEGL